MFLLKFRVSYCAVLWALLGPAECRTHYNIGFMAGGAINACECGAGCSCRTRETRYIQIGSCGRAPHGTTAPNSHSAFAVRCQTAGAARWARAFECQFQGVPGLLNINFQEPKAGLLKKGGGVSKDVFFCVDARFPAIANHRCAHDSP